MNAVLKTINFVCYLIGMLALTIFTIKFTAAGLFNYGVMDVMEVANGLGGLIIVSLTDVQNKGK